MSLSNIFLLKIYNKIVKIVQSKILLIRSVVVGCALRSPPSN